MGAKNVQWSEIVAIAKEHTFGSGSATGDGKRCARARAPYFDASPHPASRRDYFIDQHSTITLTATDHVPTSLLHEVLPADTFDLRSPSSPHFAVGVTALAYDKWASKSRDAPVSTTIFLPASDQVPTFMQPECLLRTNLI